MRRSRKPLSVARRIEGSNPSPSVSLSRIPHERLGFGVPLHQRANSAISVQTVGRPLRSLRLIGPRHRISISACPTSTASLMRRRAQRLDIRRLDEARDCPPQCGIRCDKRICLEAREGHILSVVGRLPAELLSDLPRLPLKHLVAQETNLQRVDSAHAFKSLSLGDLTPLRGWYSAASACERTSVGATSWCSRETSISPEAIRRSVSASTTNRANRRRLQGCA
jgi:hypothetical protein